MTTQPLSNIAAEYWPSTMNCTFRLDVSAADADDRLTPLIAALKRLIADSPQQEALQCLRSEVRPTVDSLDSDMAYQLQQIVDDLEVALTVVR